MITEYFRIAIKSILKRKLRAWLTVIGIVIGVATIVALMSLSQGMQSGIAETFEKLGISNIRIVPPNLYGPPTGDLGLPSDVVDYIDSIAGVDYANPVLMNYANVEFNKETQYLMTIAEDEDVSSRGFADLDIKVEQGRFLGPNDKDSVMIGSYIATEQFDKQVRLQNSILINEKKFKVVGIAEETGMDMDKRIYLPMSTARVLFDKPDTVNSIVVTLNKGEDIEKMSDKLDKKLERKLGKDNFDVFSPTQMLESFNSIMGAVTAVLIAIAAISIIVGAVGIMNSMYTSVLERFREIGVMKAIGARNGDVLTIFLIESGIIGLIGGLMGALIGYGIAKSVEVIATFAGFPFLSVAFDLGLIGMTLFGTFVLGMCSGALPAMKASKLKPVDALRYE